MRHLTLEITAEEKLQLEKALRTHPKPHARERAYALLKVSEGLLIKDVAAQMPVRRQARTVSDWVKAYKERGLAGLVKSPGSGRKPAFFPSERSGSPPKSRASHRRGGKTASKSEPMDT